jgi:hypothetical protein
MKVTIRYVKDAGNIANERVVMRVVEATNIGHYILGETQFQADDTVLATLRRVYWFPDKSVAAGDFVVFYTKTGEAKEGPNKAKTTNHYFYWGLEQPVWTKSDRGPALFEAPDWMAIRSRPSSEE